MPLTFVDFDVLYSFYYDARNQVIWSFYTVKEVERISEYWFFRKKYMGNFQFLRFTAKNYNVITRLRAVDCSFDSWKWARGMFISD